MKPAYRRAMDASVLIGLLTFAGIVAVPALFLCAHNHPRKLHHGYVAVGRRLHVLKPPPPPPSAPPIEKLAADLRRLYPDVHSPRPGTRAPKQRGTAAAYDGLLVLTAKALDVPTSLAELPEGFDHEAERLRVEHAITRAGLSWQIRAS